MSTDRFLYLVTIHPTKNTAPKQRPENKLSKWSARGVQGSLVLPQNQALHRVLLSAVTLYHLSHKEHKVISESWGVHTTIPLQAEVHQLLTMYFKIQPSISLSFRRKRNTWWAEEQYFFRHLFFCQILPIVPVFPSPGMSRVWKSSNASSRSLSHNHWGTRLKGKFDCIPWAI